MNKSLVSEIQEKVATALARRSLRAVVVSLGYRVQLRLKRLLKICGHDGCWQRGNPCYLEMDAPPSEYGCHEHAHIMGYCRWCGQFWGGIESFDFGNGLCDHCRDAAREDAGYEDQDEY